MRGDITESLGPGELSEAFLKIFENTGISVILCYGKTEMPPEHKRMEIIRNLHDSLIGGHKGFHQTYNKIRERYYWKGMQNEIEDFIRTCASCQEQKIHRFKTRTPYCVTDTPLEGFSKVSMDFLGPMRMTPAGNHYLLPIQCHLTKYFIAIPTRDMRAITVAEALATHLICQHGAPRAILSDNAKSFISEVLRELFYLLKIRHQLTSEYKPSTNGQVERSNAPVKDFIRCYSERFADWDRLVPFATFTYNSSLHSAINFTPFELVEESQDFL